MLGIIPVRMMGLLGYEPPSSFFSPSLSTEGEVATLPLSFYTFQHRFGKGQYRGATGRSIK
jgi:hypothetical protein